MKKRLPIMILFIFSTISGRLFAQESEKLNISVNNVTGAIKSITIDGDIQNMNWLIETDGSQYPWIRENYGWGLGYFTIVKGRESIKKEWTKPIMSNSDGTEVTYRENDVQVKVIRSLKNGMTERYIFTNMGNESISLYDIGIYTPLNDNYPNARDCINLRANVQIWEGENDAYINAIRMGGNAPHFGLALKQGSIKSYEIWERGINKGNSQVRGIISLNIPDIKLKPKSSYTLEWYVFSHNGNEDFKRKLLKNGNKIVSCNKYIFEEGEEAIVKLLSEKPLKKYSAKVNEVEVPVKKDGDVYTVTYPMKQKGEVRFDFYYDGNKHTHANCLVKDNFEKLIDKRTKFILNHQQMNKQSDLRYGAYMIYDNEGDSIYLNNTPNCNPVDRDEGAERIGMGMLLAKQYLLTKNDSLKISLMNYAKFIRQGLQTEDYITYSSVDKRGRNRGYNYMWTADFYFHMYLVTGNKQFAIDGYHTLQSMFRQFGYGFYAIGIPVRTSLKVLKMAGMKKEYKKLLSEFIKTGDVFIKNGINYPAHEVNYEQSIVAPAIHFLSQLYLETNEQKYLEEVKKQMPVLEAFNGFQPSYHLNEVAVRHWDGYWFGKREMFGDTFPHYWSTLTATVFHYYALCTGDVSYQKRAENIVRNNLCLFFEDGTASCAYIYPYKIDGVKGKFYDSYANDQDWALVYYMLVNKGI